MPEQKTATAEKPEPASPELSSADQKRLRELQDRDREVRAHEQAHLAAAGSYAQGGATYTYERGPDQRLYAVGGEVQIDTSEVAGDPAATLQKAQVIRRAALAPTNPSAQDRSVAAQASQMASEAAAELAAQDNNETDDVDRTNGATENVRASCAACGGEHSSAAHDGMTAYAAISAPIPPDRMPQNATTIRAQA